MTDISLRNIVRRIVDQLFEIKPSESYEQLFEENKAFIDELASCFNEFPDEEAEFYEILHSEIENRILSEENETSEEVILSRIALVLKAAGMPMNIETDVDEVLNQLFYIEEYD